MGVDNVNDVSPRVQYVAAAAQTAFDYTFPIFTDADLIVEVDGVTYDPLTDYTVTGEGNDAGGTVTLTTGLAGGEIVTLYRDIPVERTTDFQQNGPLAAASFNDELDKLVMIAQQLENAVGRALRFPQSAEVDNGQMLLSPFVAWKGKYLRFNTTTGIPEPASSTGGADGVDGTDGIAVILSRETHNIPSDYDGGNPVFTNSGTQIRVYEGGVELPYVPGTTSAGEWKVTAVATGITVGAISDSGTYATVADHSGAMAADTAYIAYTIVGKTLAGDAFTVPKYQTFVKAKAGVDGTDPQMYYIRPTAGTAIKNGAGTLSIQARSLLGGVDSALSAGTIQLYSGSTLVTVANGFATGSDGYVGYLDAGDIAGASTITLRDGPAGTVYDTITLVDIADGAADTGSDAVYGYIEASNGLAFTRASDGTTWTPSGTTTRLDCTFVQAGAAVAREAWLVTRASDGTLTGATTTHGGGDLNTTRVTVTEVNSGTAALTVKFDYSFGGDAASVAETALTSIAGANGAPGLTVSLSLTASNIQCDAGGTPVSGAFTNAVGQVTVYAGSTDVTASATYSSTTSGCTGSVNTATNTPVTGAKGSYRITALAANSGYLEITVTYGGASSVHRFTAQKALAGAASVQASDTTLLDCNSGTYVDISDAISIAVSAGGTLKCSAIYTYDTTPTTGIAHHAATIKIQYRESGGTWADFPSASDVGTDAYYIPADTTWEQGQAIITEKTTTGPASPTVYEFKLLAYRHLGTANINFVSGAVYCAWAP